MTDEGHTLAQKLLKRHPAFAEKAKELALLYAFQYNHTQENWLAIGKFYGWIEET